MSLVLSRKIGEKIMVGDDITIEVNRIGKGAVRIAIEAPKDIPIHRREVWLGVRRKRDQKR
jgi:carbon storage regulator